MAGGIFILAIGQNPFAVYATIVKGAFRSPLAIQSTIKYTIPLCICALGVTLAFKMRFWNIGGEGQLIMGGVFAFAAGFVYQRNKSRKGALMGAVIGALLMSVLSVPLNYFVVYPAYVVCYNLPLDAIIGMYQAIRPSANGLLECLVTFNMPFTFFKGMLDVALCFLVYKPLSPLLHK